MIVQKPWSYCNVLRNDGMSYLLARCAQASSDYPSAKLRAGVEQSAFFLEHALRRNP